MGVARHRSSTNLLLNHLHLLDGLGCACANDSGKGRGRRFGIGSTGGNFGLGRDGGGGAKVDSGVSLGIAGKRGPVVVRVVVGSSAKRFAARAGHGGTARTALQVHAEGLERASSTLAIDVGDVVPDLAVEGVLELANGAANIAGRRDLDGHATF